MIAVRPLSSLHLHIGHHFFGAGNLGDDLTLAGFLSAMAAQGRPVHLTCASAFDRDSQARRFPQVDWLEYEQPTREAAIESCDAWVGVGDTPFQIDVGPWFLDHLAAECELCRWHRKPMYFVGIGVNEPEAVEDLRARPVLQHASHIWARDERSAHLLERAGAAGRVTAAADLAHVYLRGRSWRPIEDEVIGYVLIFDDPRQFDPSALCELVAGLPGRRHRWLAQEARTLAGSELATLGALPTGCRDRLEVIAPSYSQDSLDQILDRWGAPARLISSRYHAALIGAWAGARVLVVERSEKIRGLVRQCEFASTDAFRDAGAVRAAMQHAHRIDHSRLERLADSAADACRQLLNRVAEPRRVELPRSRAALADVNVMNSPPFQSFMGTINTFAESRGLRTFTTWSNIWEYPWLWHAALADVDWAGKHVIDLGSELSPMPWFLATRGAKVTLIETDPQWLPLWEQLRSKLDVDVSWRLVKSEALPFPDASADVVTSFSVIEHQRNKEAAVSEVARVLKPGGLFAVSFDVCEPQLGMTFPEWNGRALTLREFEDLLWLHPAFGNSGRPSWNMESIEPFLAWHRTTAPHHNYVSAAALLFRQC